MKISEVTAYTSVGLFGEQLEKLEIAIDEKIEVDVKDVKLEGAFLDPSGKDPLKKADSVELKKKGAKYVLDITFTPFCLRYDFTLTVKNKKESVKVARKDITKKDIKGLDDFKALKKDGINYRLYSPDAKGKRPLILFLHGGGECGSDNVAQMTGTLGAMKLAERYSDMYVMAPQAPAGRRTSMEEKLKIMFERGDPFKNNMGDTPFSLKGEYGWNRDYLSKVAGVIRDMIEEGSVDESRVYVIGLSMGGGGTITMCSVDPDLFAAAVPICPSMNGETYSILRSFPEIPAWIAAAYVDHQKNRTSYILDACEKNWVEGRDDIKYSIFSADELAKYGIGVNPDLTVKELLAENHNVWIPVLCNERGILDWMVSNVKC